MVIKCTRITESFIAEREEGLKVLLHSKLTLFAIKLSMLFTTYFRIPC